MYNNILHNTPCPHIHSLLQSVTAYSLTTIEINEKFMSIQTYWSQLITVLYLYITTGIIYVGVDTSESDRMILQILLSLNALSRHKTIC